MVRTRPGEAARPVVWRLLVPLVCLAAGVGFAASARDARGTELRAPGIASLADTVRRAEARVQAADVQVQTLQTQVDAAAAQAGAGDERVAAARRRAAGLAVAGSTTAVSGPGLLVVLDDAPSTSSPAGPAGSAVDPNQLVVHQSDLQAVVNALWAGGAEAMTIAGQRVVATSAVRCVGNTLLLNGAVYSPPYRVAAIGPSATMTSRLDTSPGVAQFREAAEYYGLGYTVEADDTLRLMPYRGSMTLLYAHAGG